MWLFKCGNLLQAEKAWISTELFLPTANHTEASDRTEFKPKTAEKWGSDRQLESVRASQHVHEERNWNEAAPRSYLVLLHLLLGLQVAPTTTSTPELHKCGRRDRGSPQKFTINTGKGLEAPKSEVTHPIHTAGTPNPNLQSLNQMSKPVAKSPPSPNHSEKCTALTEQQNQTHWCQCNTGNQHPPLP